jgi:hypothetical protein
MYFRHTVLCMTSDDILRYVLIINVLIILIFFQCEFWGPENGCTFKILMFGGPLGGSFTASKDILKKLSRHFCLGERELLSYAR